jgi:hypothetical protein
VRRPASFLPALLLVVPLLAGCGGGPADTEPPAGPSSPSTSGSSGTATGQPTPTTFTPRVAQVRPASWRLPYAAGRQAVVPLSPGRVLVAGGLLAGDQSTGQVVRVDVRRGSTAAAPSLAVPVHDTAGGLAGTTPLVVGGGNATEQDVVQALRGGAWHVVGHLPTTRSDLSVVPDGADPLAIGGYDGVGVPTTLLRLGAGGSARPLGRLVTGVRYAATAVAGHTAYVFGGEVDDVELGAVQAVDLRTGRTRVVARLPVPLGHAMAATVGTRILLMGGRVTPDRQTAAMWWFDPATGRFTRAGSLPHPLSDAAVTSDGRRVWLLGGEDPLVTDGVLTISVR